MNKFSQYQSAIIESEKSFTTQEYVAKIRNLLDKINLPREEINVFGAIRLNIHITVVGEITAKKWIEVVSKFADNAKYKSTLIDAPTKESGTSLGYKKGFLITATIG